MTDKLVDNQGVLCRPQPACPRCGREGRVLHDKLRDPIFGGPGEWDLRRCPASDCGLAWSDPQPLPDELHKLYDGYHTHESQGENDFLANLASPRKKRIKGLLAKLVFWRAALFQSDLAFLEGAKPGRLLDVGCGSGDLLVAAKHLGWQPTGIDFDEAAVAAANRHDGIEAFTGDLISCAFPDDSFDAVVLSHVIEHLPEPAPIFAEIQRILRPSGRLVMITPNIDAEGHRVFGRDWRGLEPPRHVLLYSPALLRRYAHQAGFGRISAFSYAAGAGGPYSILSASANIAKEAGRAKPNLDLRTIERREKMLELVGISRGELAILVAHATRAGA